MKPPDLVIEYTAAPISGGRGRLHRAVFVDGEQVPELSHPVGSPAPWATVREHEQTITVIDASGNPPSVKVSK